MGNNGLRLLLLLPFVPLAEGAAAVTNNCPQGRFFFGPCVDGACPPACQPAANCQCFGPANALDCCTTLDNRGTDTGTGNGLTRLLLALLLGSPPPNGLPRAQLSLVLCRDFALNCALYSLYCSLPAYALCMRTHCAATCGLCNDGTGLFGIGSLLLSLLGLNGGIGTGTLLADDNPNDLLAIRSGAPPLRGNGTAVGPNLVMKRNFSSSARRPPLTSAASQFSVPPGLLLPSRLALRERMMALARRLAGRP